MRRVMVAVVLALAGCGSDSTGLLSHDAAPLPPDAGGLTPAQLAARAADAQMKCLQFRDLACTRGVDCLIGRGTFAAANRAADLQKCKDKFETTVDCGKALAVTVDYQRCISQLTNLGCDVLIPPGTTTVQHPASCDGVILTR